MAQIEIPESRRRALYVAVSQGHLAVFHKPYLSWLKKRGYTVDVAAAAAPDFPLPDIDELHDIRFARSPFHLDNLRAFIQLVKVLREKRYSLVHCHTPAASALCRLAAPFARGRPVIMYTAHGFHFYEGAPARNWLVWFTLEWLMTRLTDFVVTINGWDFRAARDRLKARRARLIPGVGVNLERFHPFPAEKQAAMRESLGLPGKAFVLLYIAEFIPRKNHAFLVSALERICREVPDAMLLLPGDGPLQNAVRAQAAALGLADRVRLLGFRRDVPELASAAHVAVSASRHEGLPIGIAEAMACGLPVVASADRGHHELVVEGQTGFIFAQDDMDGFVGSVVKLARDPELAARLGAAGREHVRNFEIAAAMAAMEPIYEEAEALADRRTDKGRRR